MDLNNNTLSMNVVQCVVAIRNTWLVESNGDRGQFLFSFMWRMPKILDRGQSGPIVGNTTIFFLVGMKEICSRVRAICGLTC